jgi:hypothetical protein
MLLPILLMPINYQSSDTILCAHSNAGFLNETNSRSHTGAHIFLSENEPFPRFYGAFLSIAQIIQFVTASAAESELVALFVTAREMIPHRQTHISMGWPQPKSPIEMDDSTAAGVTNETIVLFRAKMMDMRFWWLRCHASQDQLCYYWDTGSKTGLTTTPKTTQTPTMSPPKYSCRHLGPGRHITLLLPLLPSHWPMGFPLEAFPFYFSFLPIIISPHYECCRKGV